MPGTPAAEIARCTVAAGARRATQATRRVHSNNNNNNIKAATSLFAHGAVSYPYGGTSAVELAVPRRAAHITGSRPQGNGITTVERGDPTSRSEAADLVNSALHQKGGLESCVTDADGELSIAADPQLTVLGAGTSSAVLARLPLARGGKLLATRGTVIGKSPGVVSKLRIEENLLAATRGSVVVYEELSCASDMKSESGDVLLAPRNPWHSVATLKLDGTNEVQLRGGALLARTERVLLLGTGGRTSGMNIFSRIFSCRITGRGSVAITAAGGLHKVLLEENEQYMVDSRRMVAWDLRTSLAPPASRIQPLVLPTAGPKKSTAGAAEPPSQEVAPANSMDTDGSFARQSRSGDAKTSATIYADAVRVRLEYTAKYLWAMASKWIREIALGRGDYVKLTGPGVVYLSGRRGITGLERIGVGMDWVARNLPALPPRPPPIKSSVQRKSVDASDSAAVDKPLHPDMSLAANPLTPTVPLDSKNPVIANGGIGGLKFTTKAVDKPPVKTLPQRE